MPDKRTVEREDKMKKLMVVLGSLFVVIPSISIAMCRDPEPTANPLVTKSPTPEPMDWSLVDLEALMDQRPAPVHTYQVASAWSNWLSRLNYMIGGGGRRTRGTYSGGSNYGGCNSCGAPGSPTQGGTRKYRVKQPKPSDTTTSE